jgi:CBS domain-containing protein
MRRDPPTIGPESDVGAALAAMRRDGVGLLPVVHDGAVDGVVTKSDLLALVTSDKPLSEVMSPRVVTVQADDRVVHARRVMLEHEVERLPVLQAGKLVGIVSEADIALGLARLKDEVPTNHQAAQLKEFRVADVMVPAPVTAPADLAAKDAARLMRERDVGGLPVTNEHGKLAGMVTRTDLLKLV